MSQKSPKSKKLYFQDNWRSKLRNREEILNYLKTAQRYWYSKDWYGSEKRKNPA